MAFIPAKKFEAKIMLGIADLRNAVSIISGLTGDAKVIITDDGLSFQVVSERQQLGYGNFLAELRLRNSGFILYDFEADGGADGVCNYDVVVGEAKIQEFLNRANIQHGFSLDGLSITYINDPPRTSLRFVLFDNSDPRYVDPNGASSSSSSIAEKSMELELKIPTNAPSLADINHYEVTASIPSKHFFNILKGKHQANANPLIADLQITIARPKLTLRSLGIDVSLKQEVLALTDEDGSSFYIQGLIYDNKFEVTFPFANLKALKEEETGITGTRYVEIHVDHPLGLKPLLNFPVGAEATLGNLFLSGDYGIAQLKPLKEEETVITATEDPNENPNPQDREGQDREGQASSSMPSTERKRPLGDIAADDSAKEKKKQKQD